MKKSTLLFCLTALSFFAKAQSPTPCNTGNVSVNTSLDICPANSSTLVSTFSNGQLYLSGSSCTDGLCPGSVWRFKDIAGGRILNATVTIDATVNAKLKNIDDDANVDQFGNSAQSFFAPTIASNINLNGSDRKGYVQFTIRFFTAGVGDGYSLLTNLTNLNVLNYDIDGNDAGNINTGIAGSWYRESIYFREYSAGNPLVKWDPGTFLSPDNCTELNTQWKGSLSSLCQSTGLSKSCQFAMGAQFSNPQYSFTVKLGYDYNAGGNIGIPLSQFGIRLSCFDFLMATPLPINLYEFVAKRSGNTAQLEWTTTYEQANQGFRIQRKTGSDDFTDVGFLPSQSPDGTSQVKLYYNYTDPNTVKGVSQYRILQTDIQSMTRVSEVRSLAGLEQTINIAIYPNPSGDGKVNILFDISKEGRDIIINDFMGNVVKQWKQVKGNVITAENLLPGIYTVRIADRETGNIKINKFIIVQ